MVLHTLVQMMNHAVYLGGGAGGEAKGVRIIGQFTILSGVSDHTFSNTSQLNRSDTIVYRVWWVVVGS